jgi:hypothetical protein
MSTQFKKRSGSTIREYNINAVKEMLKKGMSEGDIMTLLAMSFCPDTRIDYLNTAKEKLKMETQNSTKSESTSNMESESFTEHAKKNPHTNTCKNCGKPTPDNTTFCSKDCVEQYKTEHVKQ